MEDALNEYQATDCGEQLVARNTWSNAVQPVVTQAGDLWWDAATQTLKVWTGTAWLVIGPAKVQGVTDGSDPPAGTVGEYLEQWGQGTYNTQLNDPLVYDQLVGSLTLTPGDWMVGGGFQMEEIAAATSAVSALMGDANNLQEGMSWVVIRGVSGQDLSMTFNPFRWNSTVATQIGMFVQVVTGWAPAPTTFPMDWDIWARRMR